MEYPKLLMKNILWNFNDRKYISYQEFAKALIKYNEEISDDEIDIGLNSVALESPRVIIQYCYWDEEKEDILEPSFPVTADNAIYFTQGELLYKVHNEICEKLKDKDNKFFEGFMLWEGESPNYPDTPLYFLLQGS